MSTPTRKLKSASNLSDVASASTARTNLGAASTGSNTFTGLQSFSGTNHAGLQLNSLTTAQRDALTPANGMLIYNSTVGAVQKYDNGTWATLSGAGVPGAHASTHQSGGSDSIKLDDLAAPDDNTDLNASTSAHGLLRKLNNSASYFLNGQGDWAEVLQLTNWTPSGPTYSGTEFAKLTPSSATANVAVVLQPKGTGAIQAQLSDGTSAGGNNRGANAVDFQINRNANTQVAAGDNSAVVGGIQNSTGASGSFVGAGINNRANGISSSIPGGNSNETSGTSACCLNASGVASGDYTLTTGDEAKADKRGQHATGAGKFSVNGDAQSSVLVARVSTSNATPTALFLDGSSAKITIPNNTTWAFKILVVARRTDADGENDAWEITGLIHRDANAASTALDASQINQIGATTWTCAVSADTTGGALQIDVAGAAAKTIQWVARIETVETTG